MNQGILVSFGLALTTVTNAAKAQVNQWDTAGSGGVWNNSAAWSLGYVPIAGETALIGDGSIVDLNGVVTPALQAVHVAPWFTATGGLKIMSGTINTANCFIAAINEGSLLLGGTGAIVCSGTFGIGVNSPGAIGFATMDGGSISASFFLIANSGIGEMQMNAGQIDVSSSFNMANSINTTATLTMSGGVINATNFNFGNGGSSMLTLNNGMINTGLFFGGSNASATAVVLINGGTINATSFYNGSSGSCNTRQLGGTVNVDQLTLGISNGIGFYSLLGGLLDATRIFRGTTATYAFNMTGGTLITTEFGQWGNNIDLKPTGGTILPGGLNNAPTYIRGDFSLGLAASVKYQIPGDKLVMHDSGTVELAGNLVISLTSGLATSTEFIIIDNDDADPVIGAFAGHPEGSTITVTYAGTPYNLTITYAGGDGNDVVLTYIDCPADLNNDGFVDNGDINAFVTLFLAGDLAADFTNDGFLDNGDISAFIAAFLAGC